MDCAERIIPDGMSKENAQLALKSMEHLVMLYNGWKENKGDIYIITHWCNESSFEKLLQFVDKHQGHYITIVDEYEKTYSLEGGARFNPRQKQINDCKALMAEYMETVDDGSENEVYASPLGFTEMIFGSFDTWLEMKRKDSK
jgi:hypothetical protein